MKTPFRIFLLLLLLPSIVLADNPTLGKYSKQKSIKKAYLVNAEAGIDITNLYGNIYVTTWDEEKVEFDILIKVSGDNEEWTSSRLNDIDVAITAMKNLVSAQTTIGKTKNKWGKNNSIEINYTIKIPKKGAVKLDNKYGNIVTADLFNTTNITSRYGNITMGRLNSTSNTFDIEYVKSADIAFVKNAFMAAKYSKVAVGSFEKLDFDSSYTDLTALKGNVLKYDSDYGKLKLGAINELSCEGNYLTIKIDQLDSSLSLDTNYSSFKIGNVSANARNIAIDSGYTQVTIAYNSGYHFDFDVNVNYGQFNYDNDLQFTSRQEASNDKRYKGSSSKSSGNKVSIISNYGSISLTKNQ